MIVRQLCVRQSRFLALNRPARMVGRFYSTETPIQTAVETPTRGHPVQPQDSEYESFEELRIAAQERFRRAELRRQQRRSLGAVIEDGYDPEEILRNPPEPKDITLELLLASQTHLGHSTSRWNPQNSRYIFGIRDGIHIISLDQTAAYLRRAAKVVEEVAARGGLILFAGTRKDQKRTVVRAAELAKGYHIFERWIPGALTNGQQILGHCETKVVNALDEEITELKPNLEEHAALKPDLVVCLNPVENEVLLHECGLNNVPTIGIIDTDANPARVTYPIPANDDSLRSVGVIAGVLGRAGEAGQKRRLEYAREGRFTYEPVDPKELGLKDTRETQPQAESRPQRQSENQDIQTAEAAANQ